MRKLPLLFAALAATVALSGCSMISNQGSQTGVQACAAVSENLQKAATDFSSALSAAANDPKAATVALDKFVSEIAAVRGKVTNADVGAALDKATAGTKKMSDLLKAAGSDASQLDSKKFDEATTEVQQALTDFSAACTKF
jgi:hypothetical protein